MHKVTLNAILIKQMEYGDTSIIYRFFTRELGMLGVLAKGIRKTKTGSTLIALCEYELTASEPKEPGLWLFQEAFLLHDYSAMPSSSTWASAMCGMELISQIILGQEDIGNTYGLAISYLDYLSRTPSNAVLILWRFMLRVTILSGIGNPFSQCCMCHKSYAEYYAYLSLQGGLVCRGCAADMVRGDNVIVLSKDSARIISLLPEIANHLAVISLSPAVITEINTIFESYWQSHHKQPLKLKSLKVLSQF